jgi:hypothetical protein
MTPSFGSRLGAVYARYGPGRLPGADRRVLGAGYACAATVFASVLLFASLGTVAELLGLPAYASGLALFVAYAVPVAVPVAFCLGVLVWRVLPDRVPFFGGLAGFVATLLVYPVCGCLLAVLLYAFPSLSPIGTGPNRFVGAVLQATLLAFFALVFTSPVALPVGTANGYAHERAWRARVQVDGSE